MSDLLTPEAVPSILSMFDPSVVTSRSKAFLYPLFSRLACATLALAAGSLSTSPAQAVVVTVAGASYDVLVTNRSLDADPGLFSATAMPWFTGDPLANTLAYDFAAAIFDQLGTNSYAGYVDQGGPLFAYANDASTVYAVFQDANNQTIQNEIQVLRSQPFNYAYLNPTPVPAPLPFAGAAFALHWSRSLRSRQRARRAVNVTRCALS